MSIKTRLLIPPKYDLSYPPLGTAALLGFLRLHQKQVDQYDANHAYACHFMDQLQSSSDALATPVVRYAAWKALHNQTFLQKQQSGVYYEQALQNLFDEAAYDDWSDSSFHFAENLLEMDCLEQFLSDEKENTFLQYYLQSKIGEKMVEDKIDLLGISIIAPSQIIPTLTLAKYLKDHFKDAPKIVIGGQWCTLYHKPFLDRPDFTKWIDYLIRGEGEQPLLSLIEVLEGKGKIQDVSNLIFAKDSKWVATLNHTKEDMRKLPAPDFEGLPLNQYFSFMNNKIGLTYETSRECYWNRCTYCVDLPLPHEGYRVKPVETVVEEIKALKEKYDCDYIIFSDPAIAPSRLKAISEAMVREGIQIPFWCFGRLEANFTKEIFEVAKQAGCDEIDFGMETANQRLMDLVDKGTTVKEVSRIIRDCSESGIHTSLQIIFRFPTETYEEGLETVHFLVDHKKWIHEVSANIYYLTPGNHMFNDPERFKIKIVPGQPSFRFFHVFENTNPDTISYQDAYQLIDLHRLMTSDGTERTEVRKGWLEKSQSGDVLEIAEPYLHEIEDVLDLRWSFKDIESHVSLFVLQDGTPVGFISREQAQQLRDHLNQVVSKS